MVVVVREVRVMPAQPARQKSRKAEKLTAMGGKSQKWRKIVRNVVRGCQEKYFVSSVILTVDWLYTKWLTFGPPCALWHTRTYTPIQRNTPINGTTDLFSAIAWHATALTLVWLQVAYEWNNEWVNEWLQCARIRLLICCVNAHEYHMPCACICVCVCAVVSFFNWKYQSQSWD